MSVATAKLRAEGNFLKIERNKRNREHVQLKPHAFYMIYIL